MAALSAASCARCFTAPFSVFYFVTTSSRTFIPALAVRFAADLAARTATFFLQSVLRVLRLERQLDLEFLGAYQIYHALVEVVLRETL